MKLTLRSIRNSGEMDREHIILRARQDIALGDYAIFRAEAKNEAVYASVSHAFWFPDEAANEGDLIVVYTKSGKQGRKENGNGSSSHFFYWGLGVPLWNASGFAPVLLEIARWKVFFSKAGEE